MWGQPCMSRKSKQVHEASRECRSNRHTARLHSQAPSNSALIGLDRDYKLRFCGASLRKPSSHVNMAAVEKDKFFIPVHRRPGFQPQSFSGTHAHPSPAHRLRSLPPRLPRHQALHSPGHRPRVPASRLPVPQEPWHRPRDRLAHFRPVRRLLCAPAAPEGRAGVVQPRGEPRLHGAWAREGDGPCR